MGLSAQQARLLTITARQADATYESMSISNQKLSLARDAETLSSEYQDALDKTTLMYDFYGTGESTEALQYSLFMTPSALNDYMPITLTNSAGRTVLDSSYANAARAAGIPQEGLGGVTSTTVRNQFIQGLADESIITQTAATTYMGIDYNQTSGVNSSTAELTYTTTSGTLSYLQNLLGCEDNSWSTIYLDTDSYYKTPSIVDSNGSAINNSGDYSINLAQLLSDDAYDQVYVVMQSGDGANYPTSEVESLATDVVPDIVSQIYDSFATCLTTGNSKSTEALNYAYMKTLEKYNCDGGDGTDRDDYGTQTHREKKYSQSELNDKVTDEDNGDYVGVTYISFYKSGLIGNKLNSAATVNVNNIAQTFLTYFASYMEGLSTSTTDANSGSYYIDEDSVSTESSSFVTDDLTYVYYFPGETTISDTDEKIVQYYDTLLNLICTSGWTENDQVNDSDYLQEMIKNGMMYITKQKDDGLYYQTNYGTDTYLKEVSDETYIAKAEATYNTETAKLDSREQVLDLELSNLDTEISSLSTEYDSIQSTITSNIERTFTRYNA